MRPTSSRDLTPSFERAKLALQARERIEAAVSQIYVNASAAIASKGPTDVSGGPLLKPSPNRSGVRCRECFPIHDSRMLSRGRTCRIAAGATAVAYAVNREDVPTVAGVL